jgi:hypothetical protein
LSITQQLDLDIITFNKLLRDAVCIKLKETEGGQEYLKEC